MDFITCPEPSCPLPAEVVDRAILGSCTGPVPHLKTVCASRHYFILPASKTTSAAEPIRASHHPRARS